MVDFMDVQEDGVIWIFSAISHLFFARIFISEYLYTTYN
jgi:hypothetical protein